MYVLANACASQSTNLCGIIECHHNTGASLSTLHTLESCISDLTCSPGYKLMELSRIPWEKIAGHQEWQTATEVVSLLANGMCCWQPLTSPSIDIHAHDLTICDIITVSNGPQRWQNSSTAATRYGCIITKVLGNAVLYYMSS